MAGGLDRIPGVPALFQYICSNLWIIGCRYYPNNVVLRQWFDAAAGSRNQRSHFAGADPGISARSSIQRRDPTDLNRSKPNRGLMVSLRKNDSRRYPELRRKFDRKTSADEVLIGQADSVSQWAAGAGDSDISRGRARPHVIGRSHRNFEQHHAADDALLQSAGMVAADCG